MRVATLILGWLAMTATAAAANADFSGTWVLNVTKGENLGMVAALQETLVLSQSDDALVADYTDVFQGKETKRQVTYDLGGAPVENFAAMGDPSETETTWDGASLVTTWTSEGAVAGTKVVKTETHELSADGQVLTITTARGDRPPMVLVYEKQ
jgi:hypothetical protein